MKITGYLRNMKNRETGKMANKNSLQGKLFFSNTQGKLRELKSDMFFLICWSSFSWTMICDACLCSGKFNVLTISLPKLSCECTSLTFNFYIYYLIFRRSRIGVLNCKQTYLNSASISGKTHGKLREFLNRFPMGTLYICCSFVVIGFWYC